MVCTGEIIWCKAILTNNTHTEMYKGQTWFCSGAFVIKNIWYKSTTKSYLISIKPLTHWGRVTHICVNKITIIGSDNGLSPAITWTNVGILLIGPLGTNFGEMLIEIRTFSFKKIHLKMSSGKWRPSCLGLNVLNWMTFGTLFCEFLK